MANLEPQQKREIETKSEMTQTRPVFAPAVDIYESDGALVLVADMPGVDRSGVELHLEENQLTIRGRVVEEKDSGDPLYSEYRSGDFFRSFTLSNVIDQEKIEATMKDGVLTVILPKAEAARPRQIAVTAG